MPSHHQILHLSAGESGGGRPDASTLLAFAGAAVFAGGNAVAIRLGLAELAPFWGAAVRFLCASLILFAVVIAMRLALPRGRALVGAVVYGFLNFGLGYMFLYQALIEVTAGTVMVVLAIVPLLTLVLAVLQRVERFHVQGLIGAILAVIGIAIVFRDSIGVASVGSLLAVLVAALSFAEVNIVIKKFPRVHPLVENAVGMAVGGGFLLILSLALGEARGIPGDPWTLYSLVYLIVFGSIGVFVLYLILLGRWTATGASYVLLVAPLVTVVLGAVILDEPAGPVFLIGGAAVLAGVYVGAFMRRREAGPG
jgi:drug/metabolite transporter (DMT)-like permease